MQAERCQQPMPGDTGEWGWERGVMGGCHPSGVLPWHLSLEPPRWLPCAGLVLGLMLQGRMRDADAGDRELQLGMLGTGLHRASGGTFPFTAGEVLTPAGL